eukprot:10017213-Alexandrium_andersonii.AAC.1
MRARVRACVRVRVLIRAELGSSAERGRCKAPGSALHMNTSLSCKKPVRGLPPPTPHRDGPHAGDNSRWRKRCRGCLSFRQREIRRDSSSAKECG